MLSTKKPTSQIGLFNSISDQLNQKHPLYLLANSINWSLFDESFKKHYSEKMGKPEVQQFRDQVNSTFDLIAPTVIGIKMRNAKAKERGKVRPPSPISFKLEGIIQLYSKCNIDFVWPQTITAFKKKNGSFLASKNKYQQDAFDIAYYLLTK
jgi:hypothetical protein